MTNPEDEAIHAAQEILQEDRALDVPITFHTRFVDLAPLICSFEIGDTVDGIFRRLVFDPAFAQSLAVVAENDPAFLDRTTADL